MACKFGELKSGNGKVLCRADVTVDGWLTIRGVCLYQDKEGSVQLGLPQRNYQANGQTKYADVVTLSDAARESLRKRLHEAYQASSLCGGKPAPSGEGAPDPFE